MPNQSNAAPPTVQSAVWTTALLFLVALLASFAVPNATLSENQYLYIFSSTAQVVGALYGLTIAGYVFLRNQQDRLADRDETLVEILDRLQASQFRFVVVLTVLSVMSILVSVLALSLYPVPIPNTRNFASALGGALFVATIWWTGRFVVDAMRPGAIERVSKDIKAESESSSRQEAEQPGGLERFLRSFNEVEAQLDDFAETHLSAQQTGTATYTASASRNYSSRPRWTKSRIARALVQQEVIDSAQAEEIVRLIRYRNALVHGQDMSVSDEAVSRVQAAAALLTSAIRRYQDR